MPSRLACHQKSRKIVQTIGPESIASRSSQHPMAVTNEPATRDTSTFIHANAFRKLSGHVELIMESCID